MMGLPTWFRATFVLLFGVLFTAYLAVRGNPTARASESRLAIGAPLPLESSAPSTFESLTGAYRLNGVPVRAERLRIPGRRPLERLERELDAAGYVTRRRSIAGRPSVIGLHPETRVLVTGSIEGDEEEDALVRLAEHRLGAKVPALERTDLPIPPGAESIVHLRPEEAARPLTLSFVLAEPPAAGSRRVEEALEARGWMRRRAAGDGAGLDFERRGERAVVLARSTPDGRRSVVWIEIDESPEARR